MANYELNKDLYVSDTNLQLKNLSHVICVGSQVIYGSKSGTGSVSKTNLLDGLSYDLINAVFNRLTIPTGYHKELRMTAQINTGGSGHVQLFLNNISTNQGETWSNPTFMGNIATEMFKMSDIVLEKSFNHGNHQSVILKYLTTVESGKAWTFSNVTIHGYLVPD